MPQKYDEQPRRRYNKALTKQRLVRAVGKVFTEKGYSGLKVSAVARAAGLDKKLIYDYFGSFDNLVEIYLKNKDYWQVYTENLEEIMAEHAGDYGAKLGKSILINQYDFVEKSKEMQKILIWEISEKNKIIREIVETREKIGSELFKISDPLFSKTDIDTRACYAVLVAGIYFLILHAASDSGTFCELDINKPEDKLRVLNMLNKMIDLLYKEAEEQTK